jgi:hypothetical protein
MQPRGRVDAHKRCRNSVPRSHAQSTPIDLSGSSPPLRPVALGSVLPGSHTIEDGLATSGPLEILNIILRNLPHVLMGLGAAMVTLIRIERK